MKQSLIFASAFLPFAVLADYGLWCTGTQGLGWNYWEVNIPVSDLNVDGSECQEFESHLTNNGLSPMSFSCDKRYDGPEWKAVLSKFLIFGFGNASPNIEAAINNGAPNGGTPCVNCCTGSVSGKRAVPFEA